MAELSEWKICHASVIGSSHTRTGTPCQDACGHAFVENQSDRYLILFAADGAGSAKNSKEGAEFACDHFRCFFSELLRKQALDSITRDNAILWLRDLRTQLILLGQLRGADMQSFASTFTAAILGEASSVYFQIGDGSIVANGPADVECDPWVVFWPTAGEYANQTSFVTSVDAESRLEFEHLPTQETEVALLTDGLQRLALHVASRSVHQPFFAVLFAPLRNSTAGYSESLSHRLAGFLSSSQVLKRTDDDKTLVLATRFRI